MKNAMLPCERQTCERQTKPEANTKPKSQTHGQWSSSSKKALQAALHVYRRMSFNRARGEREGERSRAR
jgi:hypothetical protein